jgi:hypothetical protein
VSTDNQSQKKSTGSRLLYGTPPRCTRSSPIRSVGMPSFWRTKQLQERGVRDELARLAQTSTDEDIVVVAFSGHGSSTRALVPHDADPTQSDQTFLPLDELAHSCSTKSGLRRWFVSSTAAFLAASMPRCIRLLFSREALNLKPSCSSRSLGKAALCSRPQVPTSRPTRTTASGMAC